MNRTEIFIFNNNSKTYFSKSFSSVLNFQQTTVTPGVKKTDVCYECNLFFYFFIIKTFFSLFETFISDKHVNKNQSTTLSQP